MLANRSCPGSTVIPELPYPDVEKAVEWLCNTFGFTLRIGIGNHRAQLNVGDGAMVVTDRPFTAPSSVMVRVEDVDAHHARAKARGANILRAPSDFPYGERQYNVDDLAGHHWTFTQSIADVDPRDWGGEPGTY